jgi:hypothetical protein
MSHDEPHPASRQPRNGLPQRLTGLTEPWLASVVAAAVTQLALAAAVVAFNAPDTSRLLWCTGSIRTLTFE